MMLEGKIFHQHKDKVPMFGIIHVTKNKYTTIISKKLTIFWKIIIIQLSQDFISLIFQTYISMTNKYEDLNFPNPLQILPNMEPARNLYL